MKKRVFLLTVINGAPITTINRATLLNPEVLDEYITIGGELRDELAKRVPK